MNKIRSRTLCCLLCSALLNAQALNEIKTEGPRPLDEALQSIETHFNTPLFYEEIPHENMLDLVPGSELGMNPLGLFLKWRKLDATIVQPATVQSAVSDILSAYQTQGLPGAYTAVSYRDLIAVVPKTMTNVSGSQVQIEPLLETHITIARMLGTRPEILAAILHATSSARNRPINHLPFSADIKKIVFSAENESSAAALVRLEDEFEPFTCHLLYDPSTRQYYANFKWLRKDPPPSKPAVASPGNNSPWFTIPK